MLCKEYQVLANRVLKTVKLIEPGGMNYNYYKKRFDKMTDADFEHWMDILEKDKENIHVYAPNLKVTLRYEDIAKAADFLGITFFHHLVVTDEDTGVEYLTNEKYMVVELPVRRLQQTLDEKISIPKGDTRVDMFTGQVMQEDRACAFTTPEIQATYSNGYEALLEELTVVRGGNLDAYATFRNQLEELGEANVSDCIGMHNIARSIVILDVYLTAMGYSTNLTNRKLIPRENKL